MAELAYVSLLIVDYVIQGSFSFSSSEALHNLKVGFGGWLHYWCRDRFMSSF